MDRTTLIMIVVFIVLAGLVALPFILDGVTVANCYDARAADNPGRWC